MEIALRAGCGVGFPRGTSGKETEPWVLSPGREDPLEEGLATPVFSPGEAPGTEEPGGLQSAEPERVRHD